MMAAALFAVDPVGIGGVLLRSAAGPARDQWLTRLRHWLPAETPWRRVPAHIGDDRLIGGLDLVATLNQGRPVARTGLLAEASGGIVVLAMAERSSPSLASRIAATLDTQEVSLQRDGLALRLPARVGVVALDESCDSDEHVPGALAERLALHLSLGPRPTDSALPAFDLPRARWLLPEVRIDGDIVTALCEAAQVMGIDTMRAPWLAWRVARAAAALQGRREVTVDDAALAARLVLGPRARAWPKPGEEPSDETGADPPPQPPSDAEAADPSGADPAAQPLDAPLEDRLLDAAAATLPPDLLAAIAAGLTPRKAPPSSGRSGSLQRSLWRGRPIGAMRGELRGGARLDLLQTLRAAAPWQPLRRCEGAAGPRHAAILVRREDFHVRRYRQRSETTTVFAVDASGSQALHRLAEAKGAVELLLADCYVRRDRVAVLAFRGNTAELLLPPTRSLVRAKRSLAGLPGGGGTPLAAGIDAARYLADAIARQGGTPLLVLLTDGRANIALDGSPGRPKAMSDAMAAARAWRSSGQGALLVDTAPQAQAAASELAAEMGARYVALPNADSRALAGMMRGQR
jgi:magnesium chelatase subunit D